MLMEESIGLALASLLYLHTRGPWVHTGVEYCDKDTPSIILRKPCKERRRTSLFFGEQPMKREWFFSGVRSHDRTK